MRQQIKRLIHPILKHITQRWFSKPRPYSYDGITVLVMPDVFPPNYTISTKILLDFIKELNLKDKTVLELGCGSGIVALFAASKGAIVTASDINIVALDALKNAALENNFKIDIINSNLFAHITNTSFDYIIINPPYYPKNPKNMQECAWFCGENFEYFKNLFQQLTHREDKTVFMILSEDCEIDTIKQIAKQSQLQLNIVCEKKAKAEKNYIFEISTI